MPESEVKGRFTIYLDGHEGHRGNVLAHAFVGKVQKLVAVLSKMERAYLGTHNRQTDFEIVDADKFNPTTLSLTPVPKTKDYNPSPALDWSLDQIEAVARGDEPDSRINSEIAFDLVRLATKESETGYRAFWINGRADPVRFDDEFAAKAAQIAHFRVRVEMPTRWRVGTAEGSVVGELKKVDDLERDNEFVVVPPVGAEKIVCTFSPEMREQMGQHLFKIVRVTGKLYYGEESPFPSRVDAVSLAEIPKRRRPMTEMRGLFAHSERVEAEWSSLLHGV